ncbi:hypothetical protein [Blastococcus saxobsidens]|uniref:Uncharacterized protein n=1 Tax=Blastococcus saxobsidens (strain DD2) TaxID=1146883 RepID=H6RL44_BLASD|nr:hypothetical protein [Blastococcus saxobsidens]CCG01174.1 conserved exported protein of unknown function [Blastococcus saxobsidens DD2]
MHPHPQLRLSHLPLPAAVLSLVYLAAIAVAVSAPGQHAIAGLVVLTGLTARWVAHARRTGRTARPVHAVVVETTSTVDAVLAPEPATAPVPARAA